MTDTPDTAEFPFTSEDVEGLLGALGDIVRQLPKEQWRLLLSIFAAAAGHVEVGDDKTEGRFSEVKVKDDRVITDPEAEQDVEKLLQQLRTAYMPCKTRAPIGFMISPPNPNPPPKK